MSQILQYFRSLFNVNPNNSRKRRRTEQVVEEQPFPIKYRRVSNIFPNVYTRPIDNDDFFEEVKQRKPIFNEYLDSFIMDQQKKQYKVVLEDGEFSDEDELSSRCTAQQRKILKPTYNSSAYRNSQQQQQQPKATTSSNNYRSSHQLSSSAFRNEDLEITMPHQRSRAEMPSLIPIASKLDSLTNGHHGMEDFNRSISVAGQSRGRKSIFDIGKKSIPYTNSPAPLLSKSVITQQKHMEVKDKYDDLLMQLGCYKVGGFADLRRAMQRSNNAQTSRSPIATIDLSDENDFTNNTRLSKNNFILSDEIRKHDLKIKSQLTIDLSDNDDNDVDAIDDEDFKGANFSRREAIFSSTFVKPTPGRYASQNAKLNASTHKTSSDDSLKVLLPDVKPINTLKEKQAFNKACEPDAIEKICQKFQELRQVKDQNILEEQIKALQFEKERIQYERQNQKRIEESLLNVALDKCIIFDEEDAVDEFPALTEKQNRVVNFALHGPRQEIIVSKFKMDVTRYDFATLDGLNWLNDMVINFYLELLKERSEQVEYLPKVHVMNTVFLGKLLEQGYSSVRRWTRKVDIFAYDVIPVPVHVGGVHWCMSIIHLKNKTIKYYDSMGHPNYAVLETLENYLKEESLDKRKVTFDTSDWTLECVRDCPQQKNGSDCGVFSCQFAEFVSRDSAISFEQQHMPYFRRKMIFEIASGKLMLN